MKKTILLTLAFLAGMFATDNTARRGDNKGDNKSGRFNFLPVLCIVLFSAITSACATQYYQYKSGESNWNAAHTKCLVDKEKAKRDNPDAKGGHDFVSGFAVGAANALSDEINSKFAYEACLAKLGWLPCSKGGTAAHGCKK